MKGLVEVTISLSEAVSLEHKRHHQRTLHTHWSSLNLSQFTQSSTGSLSPTNQRKFNVTEYSTSQWGFTALAQLVRALRLRPSVSNPSPASRARRKGKGRTPSPQSPCCAWSLSAPSVSGRHTITLSTPSLSHRRTRPWHRHEGFQTLHNAG